MGITSSLISVLKHGLSIYDTKQSRKYFKEVVSLEQEYNDEIRKDESNINNAILDNLELRLSILAKNFTKFGISDTND